jgi:hypothetical protein
MILYPGKPKKKPKQVKKIRKKKEKEEPLSEPLHCPEFHVLNITPPSQKH